MKVLLVNGSPNKEGCTFTALSEVAGTLQEQGATTEIFHIGSAPVRGCIACGKCARTQRCVFDMDPANTIIEKIIAADGVVLGSPVYYAGVNGALCALLDRAFYAGSRQFVGKVGAAVVSCRRAGSSSALDRLQKYFTISRMPLASSQYWNMVHGNTPDEVRQDEEGLQIMRTLGRQMAYLIGSLKAGGLELPQQEHVVRTNFIH